MARQPLAIELAAARTRLLRRQAIRQRLDQRFSMLTAGARDAPPRQQTLRDTVEWSYDLLEIDEQKLLVNVQKQSRSLVQSRRVA